MSINCLVFTKPPLGFQPTVEVAGCFCEWNSKILFLKRHPKSPQGGTWSIPAGKMEKNETPKMTVIREIKEEVGLDIGDDNLKYIRQFYCKLPHVDYVFHLFRKKITGLPGLNLQLEENIEMDWLSVEEALQLNLISGGSAILNFYIKSCLDDDIR